MWTHQESMMTQATPGAIWALFADVPGWKNWNAGIAQIQLHGSFVNGATFWMELPDGTAFTSTLQDVRPGEGFSDETIIDGNRVWVQHLIEPQADGRTQVTYRTEITGPQAAEFGPMVTADFAAVLQTLKAAAERA